jgi:hypothetical protein
MRNLGPGDRERIGVTIRALETHGPALSSRFSKRIRSSRHHNMKELRSVGGNLRVLYAFDPNRKAILLLGGDKTNNWVGWYRSNVPKADRLYDQHLGELGREGAWRSQRTGARSLGR